MHPASADTRRFWWQFELCFSYDGERFEDLHVAYVINSLKHVRANMIFVSHFKLLALHIRRFLLLCVYVLLEIKAFIHCINPLITFK